MKTAFTFPFFLQLSTCCSLSFFLFLFLHCTSLLSTFKLRGSNAPQTNNQFHKSNGFWRITSTVKCFSVDAVRSEVFLNRPPRTRTLTRTHIHTHTHTHTLTHAHTDTSGGNLHNECTDQEGEVQQGGGAGEKGEEWKWTEKPHLKYSTFRSVHLLFYVFSNFINIHHDYVCVFICSLKDFFGFCDHNASCV